MHPIERLRMVARAEGAGPTLIAQEAAAALAGFAHDPAGLVTACRRLVDRRPSAAPVWWLAAQVLVAGDPLAEACRLADELHDDPTPDVLAACLPDDGRVCVVGWPEHSGAALMRRGDLEVFVVDVDGAGASLVRRLRARNVEAELVPPEAIGPAASTCGLVLLEASALGHDGAVAAIGSRAAAAVGRHAGAAVWMVAGVGRVLPHRLHDELVRRLRLDEPPWDAVEEELVPCDLFDAVVGPAARESVTDALARPTCPVVPELLKEVA